MRFLSLFSGIEAASMAWLPLGWRCVGVAEIEKFPSAVLAHHYPDVPNLGDITKITREQIEALGEIDLVVGGFPCQDLSIAGKRKGLKNEDGSNTRSGLFFDAMRIVRWANARFLLLENVPGIYSSNLGRDFASMVGEILGVRFDVPADGWRNTGVAASERGLLEWATLDAQWFGVPQRRRRMFALADFGNWRSRPPVLFERHSLSGNPAPRREKGKVAPTIPSRSTAGGGLGTDFDCDGGLQICKSSVQGDPVGARHVERQSYASTGDISHYLNAGDGAVYEEGDKTAPLTTGTDPSANIVAAPLTASYGKQIDSSDTSKGPPNLLMTGTQVRRLTPRECERLQGFPDDYTMIPLKQFNSVTALKWSADGSRYKALGNSMAVPVMRWIGERIATVNRITA